MSGSNFNIITRFDDERDSMDKTKEIEFDMTQLTINNYNLTLFLSPSFTRCQIFSI